MPSKLVMCSTCLLLVCGRAVWGRWLFLSNPTCLFILLLRSRFFLLALLYYTVAHLQGCNTFFINVTKQCCMSVAKVIALLVTSQGLIWRSLCFIRRYILLRILCRCTAMCFTAPEANVCSLALLLSATLLGHKVLLSESCQCLCVLSSMYCNPGPCLLTGQVTTKFVLWSTGARLLWHSAFLHGCFLRDYY